MAAFLSSSQSLRTQLFFSFGLSALVSMILVVALSCIAAKSAGITVKRSSAELLRTQVIGHLGNASGYVAESFTGYVMCFKSTADILTEVIQDRLEGYPSEGWMEDRHVPFLDPVTRIHRYPLRMKPPPLDWQLEYRDEGEGETEEHLQERVNASWRSTIRMTTKTASFHMQGICDPSETNVSSPTFYPNCTDANNNIQTGGIVQPSPTTHGLYTKSGDLSIFLKPLFESHPNLLNVGIYFYNSGAGASLIYPGMALEGSYVSQGCEWLKTINKLTGRPFGTREEIAKCHAPGTVVSMREFNPIETEWCSAFALHYGNTDWHQPKGSSVPMFHIGRSVFDRSTGEFIGCVMMTSLANDIQQRLSNSVMAKRSRTYVVRYNDGSFYARSDRIKPNETFIWETDVMDREEFDQVKQELGFDSGQTELFSNKTMHIMRTKGDMYSIVTFSPVPLPPQPFEPGYRPRALIIHAIARDVFKNVLAVRDAIDQDTNRLNFIAIVMGLIGLAMSLMLIWCVSIMLTRPLNWIDNVSWGIVNHTQLEGKERIQDLADRWKTSETVRLAPRTEIDDLVSEFRKLIGGFSGPGPARVAYPTPHEIENQLAWHSDFYQLYSKKQRRSFRSTPDSDGADVSDAKIVPAPKKKNLNPIIRSVESPRSDDPTASHGPIRFQRSRLFYWIAILITAPILLTNCSICILIEKNIKGKVPSWMEQIEQLSFQIESHALQTFARAKSFSLSVSLMENMRDVHLLSRITNWLIFDGIESNYTRLFLQDGSSDELRTCTAASSKDDSACQVLDGATNFSGVLFEFSAFGPVFRHLRSQNKRVLLAFEDGRCLEISNDILNSDVNLRKRPGHCKEEEWYVTGRDRYLSGEEKIHVRLPDQIIHDAVFHASSPIANPSSSVHLGQIGLEIANTKVEGVLEDRNSFLLTRRRMIAPFGYKRLSDLPINDIMGLFSDEVVEFAPLYRNVEFGNFSLVDEDGVKRAVFVASSPVYRRSLLGLAPDDFSRGSSFDRRVGYAFSVTRDDTVLRQPFQSAQRAVFAELSTKATRFIAIVALLTIVFVVVCTMAAVFVTNPMVRLLRIVQRLNSGAFTVDLPPLEGGSREVHRVYNTFAKLCKVVRISNTAFFSGNLKWAYHFVSDALKLFRKIGDTKAIGVASNNLGVFAHALCRESKVGPSCLIMNGECCAVKIGLRHYTEAIRIAELDFEKATDSATKAEYAQQLANRRFNRGLFLLLTSDDSCAPAKAREKGVSDILRTKDLDADVVEYWFKRKLVLKKSGAYFSILLRRVGGLTFHDDIPALRQAWRVEDLIDDADRLLHAAWNEVKSPLFQRLSHAGRLQQLEGVAIHLQMQRGETLDAARLATRMFIEDSFLLEAPFAIASKALLAATSPGGGVSLSPKALSSLHHDIRLMALSCKNVFVSIRQNVVFCFELGHTWKGDIVLDGMRQICLKIFDRRCGENDHVGIVSNAAEKGLSQALSPVSPSARKKLRETLMSAAISTGKGEALTIAVQMILDSDLTHDRDTFLIYFSDGSKVDATEFASLQRRVARFNEKADTAMHIFAAGVGIRDDKTKDVLRKICEVSKSSMYKECSRDTVDELFYDISTRMGRDRDLSGQFNKFGATLEQF